MLIGFMKAEQSREGETEREEGRRREKRDRNNFIHRIQARSLF